MSNSKRRRAGGGALDALSQAASEANPLLLVAAGQHALKPQSPREPSDGEEPKEPKKKREASRWCPCSILCGIPPHKTEGTRRFCDYIIYRLNRRARGGAVAANGNSNGANKQSPDSPNNAGNDDETVMLEKDRCLLLLTDIESVSKVAGLHKNKHHDINREVLLLHRDTGEKDKPLLIFGRSQGAQRLRMELLTSYSKDVEMLPPEWGNIFVVYQAHQGKCNSGILSYSLKDDYLVTFEHKEAKNLVSKDPEAGMRYLRRCKQPLDPFERGVFNCDYSYNCRLLRKYDSAVDTATASIHAFEEIVANKSSLRSQKDQANSWKAIALNNRAKAMIERGKEVSHSVFTPEEEAGIKRDMEEAKSLRCCSAAYMKDIDEAFDTETLAMFLRATLKHHEALEMFMKTLELRKNASTGPHSLVGRTLYRIAMVERDIANTSYTQGALLDQRTRHERARKYLGDARQHVEEAIAFLEQRRPLGEDERLLRDCKKLHQELLRYCGDTVKTEYIGGSDDMLTDQGMDPVKSAMTGLGKTNAPSEADAAVALSSLGHAAKFPPALAPTAPIGFAVPCVGRFGPTCLPVTAPPPWAYPLPPHPQSHLASVGAQADEQRRDEKTDVKNHAAKQADEQALSQPSIVASLQGPVAQAPTFLAPAAQILGPRCVASPSFSGGAAHPSSETSPAFDCSTPALNSTLMAGIQMSQSSSRADPFAPVLARGTSGSMMMPELDSLRSSQPSRPSQSLPAEVEQQHASTQTLQRLPYSNSWPFGALGAGSASGHAGNWSAEIHPYSSIQADSWNPATMGTPITTGNGVDSAVPSMLRLGSDFLYSDGAIHFNDDRDVNLEP